MCQLFPLAYFVILFITFKMQIFNQMVVDVHSTWNIEAKQNKKRIDQGKGGEGGPCTTLID